MKKINQVRNLVWLQNIGKCRHGSAAIMNLVFDLCFAQTFPHNAQIRSKLPTLTIHSVAMFTPFLMKERGSRLLTFARVGLNNRCRPSRQTAKESDYK